MSEAITKAISVLCDCRDALRECDRDGDYKLIGLLDDTCAELSQPAPLAGEVTDEQIDKICYLATEIRFAKSDDAAQAVIDKIRAILALRQPSDDAVVEEIRRLRVENAALNERLDALRPQSQPAGFVAGPLVWNPRQSEAVIKVTREAQPEHGFTHPIYAEPQAALQDKAGEVPADGWLQDGGLLYRLTDERRPQNRDEINVTMADGSRSPESRARRAGELLDRIRAAQSAPVVPDGFAAWQRKAELILEDLAAFESGKATSSPVMNRSQIGAMATNLLRDMIAASQQKGGQNG